MKRLVWVIALAACGGESAVPAAAPSAESSPPVREYRAGQFGVGSAATTAQLAAWNTDIGPEGAELPDGRGNARDGARIYAQQCAACHGAEGQGLEPLYPLLISRDPRGEGFDFASDPKIPRSIGNYWAHATTLYDYIRRAMPLYTPGSLSSDETYAVVAYLLAANRVIPDTATLDAAALRAVQMPARDKFVPDDRSPSRP
ncbi:cytochrome c [Pseudogemmatithrix spongiicola]|uniref:Cytochrome c n=1 Tax=Pseudogemmatithrix spongiicola TaxID=3062599 RepID=A0AA49Q4G1_9BACT|nr:cytochrome c [Gemmatimonadaceae bacterium 'strain 138']WKW14758.1 cytochrome c [Gemmatimonadaceae bacterium 'strain 318']